ncbi:MAG: MFS transporter [Candidatus Kryptoniota bacterium]
MSPIFVNQVKLARLSIFASGQLSIARKKLFRNFRSLRHYNYRLYWFSQLISMTGTWMQNVAQSWLVITMTGSAVALGTVTAFQFLPILFLSLFAGVYVDRIPKRRLLLVTQTVSAIQAFAMAYLVYTKSVTIWEIYILAMLLGFTNSFDQPGRQAFVAEMVPDDDIPNAVALNSLLFNTARTLGPAVAGISIALIGMALSFAINGISFVAVVIALIMMKPELLRTFPIKREKSMAADLKEGFSYVRRTPLIAGLLMILAFVGTFGYNFSTALPLLTKNILGGGPQLFGIVTSSVGIGSMLGAMVVASRARPSLRIVITSAMLFGFFEIIVSLIRNVWLSLLLLALVGASGIIYTATTNTMLQLNSPPNLRGRIMALYVMVFTGSTPIGAVFTGFVADYAGTPLMILIEGSLCIFGAIVGIVYSRRNSERIKSSGARAAGAPDAQ